MGGTNLKNDWQRAPVQCSLQVEVHQGVASGESRVGSRESQGSRVWAWSPLQAHHEPVRPAVRSDKVL